MTRAGIMDYTVCSRYIPAGGGGIRVASERVWPGAYSVSHSERLGAKYGRLTADGSRLWAKAISD